MQVRPRCADPRDLGLVYRSLDDHIAGAVELDRRGRVPLSLIGGWNAVGAVDRSTAFRGTFVSIIVARATAH
jgi:hypothetical protein